MKTLPMPPPPPGPDPKPRGKFITRVALVLAVALGGIVAVQAPAAASWEACPVGTACVYQDVDGGGAMLVVSVGRFGVNLCYNLSPSWNDTISSAYSRFSPSANIRLRLFRHNYCTTPSTDVTAGEKDNYRGLSQYRDSITSFALISP